MRGARRGSLEIDVKGSQEEAIWRASRCETDKTWKLVVGKRSMVPWLGLSDQPSLLEVRWMVNDVTVRVYNPLCFQDPSGAILSDARLVQLIMAARR